MSDKIQIIGSAILPAFIVIILVFGIIKKIPVFDEFLTGANEGLGIIIKLFPTLIGIMVAVKLFASSGLSVFLSEKLSFLTNKFGFPSELVPYIIIRPFSGGGSTAVLTDVFEKFGASSYIGMIASVLAGSTETTFYAVSVYFGSIGVKHTRHTLFCAIIADITAIIVSVAVVRLIF